MVADSETVSVHDVLVSNLTDGVPSLTRVMSCDRPTAASERIALDDMVEISFGRGDAGIERTGDRLAIRIPDERMSTSHARIVRADRRFTLIDEGSKNGTLVNGKRCDTVELADGDVIEVGFTFFVFRARVPRGLGPAPAVYAESSTPSELPLTTFVPALARQFESVSKVAKSTVPVVVLGETGTGKEVVARAVHRLSGRTGPFLALNCGAIPANLIESELFGAKKGAFSGAVDDRSGLVRAADGGSLFLDEIGELPAPAQVALLRVLQEQEVLPIGGTRPIKVDVRIIAATHRPLDRLVDTGGFRADLFARLGGLTVRLPPLRERRDDFGLIIGGLIRRIASAPDQVALTRQAARALFLYPFPSNIRELEKSLGLALTVAASDGGRDIELDDLPE